MELKASDIVNEKELRQKAEKFASDNCQRDKDGKPLDYQSLFHGFMSGADFILENATHMNYKCYNCGCITSDQVFAYKAGPDNSAKQIAICQKCYNELLKENK